MTRGAWFAFPAVLLLATACSTPTMYRWGDYDETLYAHYKNPTDRKDFVERLQRILVEAERSGAKVPPGCYAEYGYALYEQGQLSDAAVYFAKERDAWPESRALMTTMIKNAERQSSRGSPPAPPAGAPAATSTDAGAR